MKIIGLGHYSRTGKDTFANTLIGMLRIMNPELRVQRGSFAYKLKQIAFELYHWAGVMPPEYYETPEGEIARTVRLPLLASDIFPEGPTPVELWINLGTNAFRDNVYPHTWRDYLLKGTQDCDVLVVTDCRFLNEASPIAQMGGTLIRMLRWGVFPRDSRADYELIRWKGWHYSLACDDMEQIAAWAKKFATSLAYNKPLPEFTTEHAHKAALFLNAMPLKPELMDLYSVPADAA